ncbi:uncharacterized protein LOC124926195 [Impatiens glandulifera]|uniref:uncharacterized protein LOC124926195 n=1 Tax=Impatiens glandulifera TaxID=253017 RepID=UPI001FB118A6|nr:uncharacterized protein LOC124926195 [Impatiens glandulifera]
MFFSKTSLFHYFKALENPLNSSYLTSHPPSLIIQRLPELILHRPIYSSSQSETESETKTAKKPLHVLFKEAVGLSERLDPSDCEEGGNDLSKSLRKLEYEVRMLKKAKSESNKPEIDYGGASTDDSKVKTLSGLFAGERKMVREKKPERGNVDSSIMSKNDEGDSTSVSKVKSLRALFVPEDKRREYLDASRSLMIEDEMIHKELSPDMILFVRYLYKQGYFNDANFMPRNFDATCFENSYGRKFIRHAAEKFGRNNQEITMWISGSDLKKVALFGCPSLGRKTIFSAKRLRAFFGIDETSVCSKCVLKPVCNFANQKVWSWDSNHLDLVVVMRVITIYGLEAVPSQLRVPEEMKAGINRLFKEIVNLSRRQTVVA